MSKGKRKLADTLPAGPAAKTAVTSVVWEEALFLGKAPLRAFFGKGSSAAKKTQTMLTDTGMAPDVVDSAIQSELRR